MPLWLASHQSCSKLKFFFFLPGDYFVWEVTERFWRNTTPRWSEKWITSTDRASWPSPTPSTSGFLFRSGTTRVTTTTTAAAWTSTTPSVTSTHMKLPTKNSGSFLGLLPSVVHLPIWLHNCCKNFDRKMERPQHFSSPEPLLSFCKLEWARLVWLKKVYNFHYQIIDK